MVAIEFTMPIWTAILAAMFLGERMTIWKIAAIVLGIVGVVVIVRPATGEVNPGQLIALGGGRRLRRFDRDGEVADPHRADARDHVLDAGGAIGGRFVPALYVWTWPSAYRLGLGRGDRVLRHVLALLHGARDAACRCHRGDPDGFPAGSADAPPPAG